MEAVVMKKEEDFDADDKKDVHKKWSSSWMRKIFLKKRSQSFDLSREEVS